MHADSEIDPVVGIRPEGKGIFSGLRWWPPLLVATVSAIAFLPAIQNDFVDWDDNVNFTQNLHFRGLGWEQVRWAWSETRIGVYQPLSWMLLEAEYVLWGLNPLGYHAVSIVLHALTMIVLYVLAYAIIGLSAAKVGTVDVTGARVQLFLALAIALFAAHPLRTEVVAWISCQPYLPCILFYLLAVISYLEYCSRPDRGRRAGWMALSLLAFALAILFKAVAISLPVVLLILDIYPLGRLGASPLRWPRRPFRGVLLEKVPFALISVVFVWVTLWARSQGPGYEVNMGKAVFRSCYGIIFYLWKTVVPLRLSCLYPPPERLVLSTPTAVLCVLLVVTLCLAALVGRRVWPALASAWVIYVVVLAPNLGIVRISDAITADRYSYASTIGWAVLWAFLICSRIDRMRGSKSSTAIVLGLGAGLVAWLTLLSWKQCRTWRDTEALWIHVIAQQGPATSTAQRELAELLIKQGKLPAAVQVCRNALLHVRDDRDEILRLLGDALDKMDRKDEAIQAYEEALVLGGKNQLKHQSDSSLESHLAMTYNNLGLTLRDRGRGEEAAAKLRLAIDHERAALGLTPGYPLYVRFLGYHCRNLAAVQRDLGQRPEALETYHQALALSESLMQEPDLDDIRDLGFLYNDVGDLLAEMGRHTESLQALERARSIAEGPPWVPSERRARDELLARIYNSLAQAVERQGRRYQAADLLRRAIDRQRAALELSPGNLQSVHLLANHYRNLARVQRDLGQREESVASTLKSEKLQPKDPTHLYETACDFASCIPPSEGNMRQRCTELAISALSRAIDLGFRDANRMREDKSLNPLRSQSEFKVLLSQISQTRGASKSNGTGN